jgi:dTMP kinase
LFISFEGIDKSGKSTQIHLLADFLIGKNYPVAVTQEPGGTALGEKIKKALLEDERKIDPLAELFLYLADRAQHVREVIEPSLNQRKVVISDRYADATLAYQGYGRGLSIELIQKLNQEVTRGIWPDVTFLLDLEPEVAMRREKMDDRIEKERLSFHKRVREGYLKVAELYPQRVKIIRADTSPLSIHKLIKKVIMDKFNYGLS